MANPANLIAVIKSLVIGSQQSAPKGRSRKRVLGAISRVLVAAKCNDGRIVIRAFRAATGHVVTPQEAKEAYQYFKTTQPLPTDAKILAGASGDEERRRILTAAVETWAACGVDSEPATQAMESITSALGMTNDDVCAILDKRSFSARFDVAREISQIAYTRARRATTRVLSRFDRAA